AGQGVANRDRLVAATRVDQGEQRRFRRLEGRVGQPSAPQHVRSRLHRHRRGIAIRPAGENGGQRRDRLQPRLDGQWYGRLRGCRLRFGGQAGGRRRERSRPAAPAAPLVPPPPPHDRPPPPPPHPPRPEPHQEPADHVRRPGGHLAVLQRRHQRREVSNRRGRVEPPPYGQQQGGGRGSLPVVRLEEFGQFKALHRDLVLVVCQRGLCCLLQDREGPRIAGTAAGQ